MYLKPDELICIQQYVLQNGLTITEVQEDIVDHLCCTVEEKINEGIDFEEAFQAAQQLISKKEILQIQKDTIYYLTIKKQLIMIKAIFITAYASVAFLISGSLLIAFGDIIYLPQIIGFAMLLTSVSIFSLGFLPLLFLHKYKRYTEGLKA
jgi:hypothetical protein